MMSQEKNTIKELELFISEANRLCSKSFYKHFNSGEEIGFSDIPALDNSPTEEQLEAYLLHIRKFLQKNDRVCIQIIDQHVRKIIGNDNIQIHKWNQIYETFEHLCEAKMLPGKGIHNIPEIPRLSLLNLYKTRTFGDLAHLNPKKQELHLKLSSNEQVDALYRHEYYSFLFEVGELIYEMATLCQDFLESQNADLPRSHNKIDHQGDWK